MDEAPTNQLDYSTVVGQPAPLPADDTPQSTDSSMPDENQQEINEQESAENQQLAESGEFDKLAEQLNSSLTEFDMQEDAKQIIEKYTEYANSGSPEWRIWACKMVNWYIEFFKSTKGVQ